MTDIIDKLRIQTIPTGEIHMHKQGDYTSLVCYAIMPMHNCVTITLPCIMLF